MRTILKIFILLLISRNSFGTAQVPERIIYNGDTLSLFYCPLNLYPNQEIIHPKNLFGSTGCFSTACWRSYIGTWEVTDNELYLVEIRNAGYLYENGATGSKENDLGSEYADLQQLFPKRFKNGKVKADWVNEKMISPQGALLYYIHDGFHSIYETELEFTFENGTLVETKTYDNSKTKQSEFSQNQILLRDFIKNNISYENLPKTDTLKRRAFVEIASTNDSREIDSVCIVRGTGSELYDKEALRVVQSIPKWDVIYRHGEKIKILNFITVNFDQNKR